MSKLAKWPSTRLSAVPSVAHRVGPYANDQPFPVSTKNTVSSMPTTCALPSMQKTFEQVETATPDLYVLSGIAPPEIRRSVHSQNDRTKQVTDQRHSFHHHQPVKSRLHFRNSFISTSQRLLCRVTWGKTPPGAKRPSHLTMNLRCNMLEKCS